jgi:hypothetical protein
MSFITTRRMIAIKMETTEGTAIALTDGDVVHPVYDVDWTPEFQMHERNTTGSWFSKYQSMSGEQTATIKFTVEVKGAGSAGHPETVPPCLGVPLTASGHSGTANGTTDITYAPASAVTAAFVSSATVAMYEGDTTATGCKIFKIHGARGKVEYTFELGQIVRAAFTFQGVYNAPTDGTFLATPAGATFQVVPKPFFATNAAFVVNFGSGISNLKVTSFKLNVDNTLGARKSAIAANGVFSYFITNRKVTGEFTFETEAAATFNPFTIKSAGTLGSIAATVGSVACNTALFTISKAQIIDVKQGNADGIATTTVSFLATQNVTAVGDTEYTLKFT